MAVIFASLAIRMAPVRIKATRMGVDRWGTDASDKQDGDDRQLLDNVTHDGPLVEFLWDQSAAYS
jgi:hypothetical protein